VTDMTKYIIIVLACAAVALLDTIKRSKSASGFVSSAISGIAGLFAVNMMPVLGAMVSTNLFSVAVCAVFGIPGLISMILMRVLCII